MKCIRCKSNIAGGDRVFVIPAGRLCWSCHSNPKQLRHSTIREVVQSQADRLGMTAYAIAHAAKVDDEFIVSVNHVHEYLAGRKDMTSEKLDAVFKVLGLKIKVER